MNAATRSTYAAIMGLDIFETVKKNLVALTKEKRDSNSRFPVLTLSFVIMERNSHEIPEYYRLASEIGADDVVVSDIMELEDSHADLTVADDGIEVRQSYLTAKALEAEVTGPTLSQFSDMPYLPTQHENDCVNPWESFKVDDDGGVSICCYANPVFGNIFEQSISEIWNSDGIKHYRKFVNSNTPPSPCLVCPKKRDIFI